MKLGPELISAGAIQQRVRELAADISRDYASAPKPVILLPVLKGSFALLHSKATTGQPIGVMSREDWVLAEEVLVKYVGMQKVDSPDRYFTNAFVSAR